MYFTSTRNKNLRKSLSQAIHCGLASDGGLFVPDYFPTINYMQFPRDLSYPEIAQKILHEFFLDDVLDEKLLEICSEAFSFDVPLKKLNANTFLLELFHGPTSSFKDFGARFLANCMSIIPKDNRTTIMIATSGDTGSAVASAFYQKPNVDIIILYPDKKISPRQQQQIACFDKNILALAVNGTFDDCQKLVKTAFQDPWCQHNLQLSSANSINIGRLLPQIIYYAYTSIKFYAEHGETAGFIVPTGNLGNATAGYYAKQMGFPIREIVLATNANKVIPDYLTTGHYQPHPSLETLANAMDVGNPSNFERLQDLFKTYNSFKTHVKAFSVNDNEIKTSIKTMFATHQQIICPHTATASFVRTKLSDKPWIIVATADPSKFDNIEPLIGTPVPLPLQLQAMLKKPVSIQQIDNDLEEIKTIIISQRYS